MGPSILTLRTAVVDVSNVLWTFSRPSAGIAPAFVRLIPVVQALRAGGVQTVVGVADANVRTLVGGHEPPAGLFERYHVVPAGSRADSTILELARTIPACIISNDKFRAEKRRDRWAKRNVHRVVVAAFPDDRGNVQFGSTWPDIVAAIRADPIREA